MFRLVLMVLMVDCQGVDDGGVQVLMMLVFRYKFALRPEEKPGLEGFLTFLWNKETGEVSVQALMSCRLAFRGKMFSDFKALF